MSYLGVYDGHGGRQIVDYLEHALENTIAQELLQGDDSTWEEKLSRFVNNYQHRSVILIITLFSLCLNAELS